MSHQAEQALAEARRLYEERKPVGWRVFTLQGIRVAERAAWFERQVQRAYPKLPWWEAERALYGDMATVMAYVNAGHDVNLTGDLRMGFRRLCREAKGIAARIHRDHEEDYQRRCRIFGMTP
jgi:hypothetical protein